MKIISHIRKEFKDNIDERYREGSFRFFKEKIKSYGVRIPLVRKIAKKYRKNISFPEVKKCAEILLKSGWFEEGIIAFSFIERFHKTFGSEEFLLFERWIDEYVN